MSPFVGCCNRSVLHFTPSVIISIIQQGYLCYHVAKWAKEDKTTKGTHPNLIPVNWIIMCLPIINTATVIILPLMSNTILLFYVHPSHLLQTSMQGFCCLSGLFPSLLKSLQGIFFTEMGLCIYTTGKSTNRFSFSYSCSVIDNQKRAS